MENQEIILKVKKLLALSKSTNENEALSAMMMAQKFIMKYKLSIKEVEEFNDISIGANGTGLKFRSSKWKALLGRVIANNFGCYMFYRSGKTHEICFFGKEEEVTICKIMLEYAIKCIDSNSSKILKEMKKDRRRKHFNGIKSDYALGFISGLDQRFKDQVKSNQEWGLVFVKDPMVIEKYKEYSCGFESISIEEKYKKHDKIYKLGQNDGKEFNISNKIETEGENEDIFEIC